MASTSTLEVTRFWTKLADTACTVQASYTDFSYDITVGNEAPLQSAAYIRLSLAEPTTFDYDSPVYIRLSGSAASGKLDSAPVTVIV